MVEFSVNEKTFNVTEKRRTENRTVLIVDGAEVEVETLAAPSPDSSTMLFRIGDRLLMCRRVVGPGGTVEAWVNERPLRVELVNRQATVGPARVKTVLSNGPVTVEAPMAGRIVEVKAAVGMTLKEGQPMVVLEAMKMENEIAAPRDGTVKEVFVKEKALVKPGDRLVLLD